MEDPTEPKTTHPGSQLSRRAALSGIGGLGLASLLAADRTAAASSEGDGVLVPVQQYPDTDQYRYVDKQNPPRSWSSDLRHVDTQNLFNGDPVHIDRLVPVHQFPEELPIYLSVTGKVTYFLEDRHAEDFEAWRVRLYDRDADQELQDAKTVVRTDPTAADAVLEASTERGTLVDDEIREGTLHELRFETPKAELDGRGMREFAIEADYWPAWTLQHRNFSDYEGMLFSSLSLTVWVELPAEVISQFAGE